MYDFPSAYFRFRVFFWFLKVEAVVIDLRIFFFSNFHNLSFTT